MFHQGARATLFASSFLAVCFMPISPSVHVYCLGHFRIDRHGAPEAAEAKQLKPLALLKLLIALGARHVPQDQIVDSLWPDSEGDAGQIAFASTLYRLRRLIGSNAVALRNRQLTLDPVHVWCDVQEFESVLAVATEEGATACAARALDLYLGPFLDGECDPPEIIRARERLHGRFLRTIRDAGTSLEKAGSVPAAIDLYEKALEVDPLAEVLIQQLMTALSTVGRASEALDVYQRFQRDMSTNGRTISPRTENIREEAERAVVRERETVLIALSPTGDEGDVRSAASENSRRRESTGRQVQISDRQVKDNAAWLIVGVAVIVAGLVGWGVLSKTDQNDRNIAALPATSLAVPSEPSIAVLPFINMSGDATHDYFADGLTDTLITDLSQLHRILVIARNSAFAYKNRSVDVRQVGRELGVRHVLEGSVQYSKDRVRVNVQLIEVNKGTHVWAERYDRPLSDIFLMQNEIASRIIEELDVVLVSGEQARQWRLATRNADAYSEALAGRAVQSVNHTIDGMLRARAHLKRAIELDPNFALPWAYMVSVYQHLTDSGYSGEPDVSYETALHYADRAVDLNPNLAIGHAYRGAILQQLQRYEEALQEYRLAVEHGPNAAESLMLSAWGIAAVGDAREALPLAERAMRLDPLMPGWYWGGLADIYLRLGRWDDSIPAYRRCLKETIELIWCRAGLTVANARAGRTHDARHSAQEWRRIDPKVKAADNFYLIAWRDPEFRALLVKSLDDAGL